MLFKLHYNLLAILQVVVGISNLILLFHFYGTSVTSDIYLLSFSILSFVQLIYLLFSEQFIYHYNELKVSSVNEAFEFFNTALTYSFFIGIFLTLCVLFLNKFIVTLSASGLPADSFLGTVNFFNILSFSLIVYLPLFIFQNFLNAHGKIGTSYFIMIIPHFAMTLGFIYVWLYGDNNIIYLGIAYIIGSFLAFCLAIFYASRFTKIKLSFSHDKVYEFLKTSFKIRFAHNIHNVLSLLIINNFLATFPAGYASIFFYAKRVTDTILMVVYGPTHKILVNLLSHGLLEKNITSVKKYLKKINIAMPLILVPIAIAIYYIIPYLVNSFYPLDMTKVMYLQLCFLFLMGQVVLISTEVPYAVVNLTQHDSLIFYFSNTLFIILLFGLILIIKPYFNFLTLPLALFIAQGVNFLVIRYSAISLIRKIEDKNV